MRYAMTGFFLSAMLCAIFLFQNCAGSALPNMASALELPSPSVQAQMTNAVSSCATYVANGSPTTLANLATITGSTNTVAHAGQVDKISNGTGNVILLGTSTSAKVGTIENFNGNIYLCGISVDKVGAGFQGNLISVRGDVVSIEGGEANITVVDADGDPSPTGYRGNYVTGLSSGFGSGKTYTGL